MERGVHPVPLEHGVWDLDYSLDSKWRNIYLYSKRKKAWIILNEDRLLILVEMLGQHWRGLEEKPMVQRRLEIHVRDRQNNNKSRRMNTMMKIVTITCLEIEQLLLEWLL
jgi:hypothetical protein